MSLSEQAISFMVAAAAAYGPRALIPRAETGPDTPETLGGSLLRMLPGDPVPLAGFLASPADPARRAELEDWLYDALDEHPGLRAAMIAALTGYSRRRAASGDARALADLGDLLSWQDEFDAARDAYQQAVDLGHDRALLSLASLLREGLGDADGARAYLHRAIGSGDPDVAAEGMVDLGGLLCSAGDMTGGRAAFQAAIATGHPTWAPEAMMGLGHWLSMRGDRDGALAAYQQAIDSGRADLAGRAWFSVGELLYRQGDLSRARSVLQRLIDSQDPDWSEPARFQCAVVLFLMFPRHGRRQRDPMILQVTYSRTDVGWTQDPYSSGTLFGHDPIAEPGDLSDLGEQPMTAGGSMHLQEQPPPGYPAAIVTGRVDPAVTQIALIQDGHEDRRPLQSHYGAWVVCAERLGPFQVTGLASDGTVLTTLDYSFPRPSDDGS